MPRQGDLFRKPRAPAIRNPRTMFVMDATLDWGPWRYGAIDLECELCGHQTGWTPSRHPTIEREGRVCPVCKGKGKS